MVVYFVWWNVVFFIVFGEKYYFFVVVFVDFDFDCFVGCFNGFFFDVGQKCGVVNFRIVYYCYFWYLYYLDR